MLCLEKLAQYHKFSFLVQFLMIYLKSIQTPDPCTSVFSLKTYTDILNHFMPANNSV